MSLRIVIDARHLEDFGIGSYIRNLVPSLAAVESENRYTLVCQPGAGQDLAALGSRFEVVTYARPDTDRMEHFAFPAFLKGLRGDLYHIPLNSVPWWMCRPYVVTVHDMSRHMNAGPGWRSQLSLHRARRGLRRAARVMTVSNATQRIIQSVLNIPATHIRRIYIATDPRFLDGPADAVAIAGRRRILERYQIQYPYVLYVGSVRPQKNLPRLMEAFAVLKGELQSEPDYAELRLVILGDEISNNPSARRAAAQSRVGNHVRFLGHVPFETLRAFYESASVFAFPSLREGFGLPPLEAMACGAPVVTSNVSSIPEVVGNAAMLVNPDNVFEIARALKEVLLNPGMRARLIDLGLAQVRRFRWENTAREVLEVYREAARGG